MSLSLLVTGGCGFIGSNFIRYTLRHRPDWSIVNLDALTYSGRRENVADLDGATRHELVVGDVNDAGVTEPLIARCDAVVHFAAESHVDRSIIDTQPFVHSNIAGTQALLDAMRRVGGKRRLVHISTDEVYGSLPLDDAPAKFTETSPLQPNSPYAASKAAADCLVRAACHTFDLDAIITRSSNNFGPYQFPEKIVPRFVTNLLRGRAVPLYGDGQNVRDWLHVDDHAAALLAVLERGRAGAVYNIGADNERANLDLTRTILDLMGHDDRMIAYVTDRPGHDRRYAIDATKIREELGWRPAHSAWPEALAVTIDWYREHADWWRPLVDD